MNIAPHTSRIRKIGSLIALAVLSLMALLGLSRCQYGPDRVTGIDRGGQTPASRCVRECTERFEDSLEAENKLHKKNLRKCRGRDDDDDGADVIQAGGDDPSNSVGGLRGRRERHGRDRECFELERARHEAAIQRIKEGLRQCIGGCHHQGGGTGR